MQLIINALKSITSIGTGFIPQTVDQNQAIWLISKMNTKATGSQPTTITSIMVKCREIGNAGIQSNRQSQKIL